MKKERKKAEKEKPPLDKKGNKLCPTHGKAFLLVPEQHKSYTGLCGHYDCIGKMISAMCNRSKLWK